MGLTWVASAPSGLKFIWHLQQSCLKQTLFAAETPHRCTVPCDLTIFTRKIALLRIPHWQLGFLRGPAASPGAPGTLLPVTTAPDPGGAAAAAHPTPTPEPQAGLPPPSAHVKPWAHLGWQGGPTASAAPGEQPRTVPGPHELSVDLPTSWVSASCSLTCRLGSPKRRWL